MLDSARMFSGRFVWMQKIYDRVTLGNTGAIEVFQHLLVAYPETAAFDYGVLIGMGIVGSDLFLLFQECHCDIQELHKTLMEDRAKEVLEKQA